MSDIEAPTTALQDRHYLCLSIPEYKTFAEALANNCFLNRNAQACSISKAKTKKLKNLRANIRKHPFLMQSLIWKEQLRLIEVEIKRRQHERLTFEKVKHEKQ